MFQQMYQKILNKSFIKFDDFFFIQFYVKLENNVIEFSDQHKKNYDLIKIKCRKLSKQNWDMIYTQKNNQEKQKLLLVFSINETNFLNIEKENGYMSLTTLTKILSLHASLVKLIVSKINDNYVSQNNQENRNEISAQFKRLYNSDQGIILKHKEIGQYLHLCAFYQRLGLNYFDLQKLPYETYKQLLMMIGIQTEIKNAQLKKLNKKSSQSSYGRR